MTGIPTLTRLRQDIIREELAWATQQAEDHSDLHSENLSPQTSKSQVIIFRAVNFDLIWLWQPLLSGAETGLGEICVDFWVSLFSLACSCFVWHRVVLVEVEWPYFRDVVKNLGTVPHYWVFLSWEIGTSVRSDRASGIDHRNNHTQIWFGEPMSLIRVVYRSMGESYPHNHRLIDSYTIEKQSPPSRY